MTLPTVICYGFKWKVLLYGVKYLVGRHARERKSAAASGVPVAVARAAMTHVRDLSCARLAYGDRVMQMHKFRSSSISCHYEFTIYVDRGSIRGELSCCVPFG